MCFPRVVASDRLRGRPETFANCGAVAGTLARLDAQRSPWEPGDDDELLLRPGTRPQCMLADAERQRLHSHGVNPLQTLRSAIPRAQSIRTLAGGAATSVESSLLTPQRRRLLLMAAIERGTRWAMFEGTERASWTRLERQIRDFLQPLADDGLFGRDDAMPPFEIVSDERINGLEDLAAGRVNVLVSLRTERARGYHSFLLTHSREGSRVRPVLTNVLPAGTRMTVRGSGGIGPAEGLPARRPTLAQSLYGHYAEPRATPSGAPVAAAVPPAPGRFDADSVARIHRDFRRSLQGF
jgi:hypothetical protein